MTAQTRQGDPDRAWQLLATLFAVLLVLVVAHDLDHVANQDATGNLGAAFWIFLPFQYGAFALVLALVLRRDSRAPSLAALLCAIAIVAFAAAHLVPGGPLEYADYELPAISWVLVFVPMAVAAFTLAVALRVRASRRGALAESAA